MTMIDRVSPHVRRCPACDCTEWERFHSYGNFVLVRCATCTLVTLETAPASDKGVLAEYDEGYYSYTDLATYLSGQASMLQRTRYSILRSVLDAHVSQARWRRVVLSLFLRKWGELPRKRGEMLLDVGCGDGLFLYFLQEKGWHVLGVEPGLSRSAARGNLPITIFTGYLRDANLASDSFDVLRFHHSLEHMLDPLAELREARRILKPGGLLTITVPNIESLPARILGRHWSNLNLPQHIWHFRPYTITKLLERVGFQDIKVHRVASWTPLKFDSRGGLKLPLTLVSLILGVFFEMFGVGDWLSVRAVK